MPRGREQVQNIDSYLMVKETDAKQKKEAETIIQEAPPRKS